MGRTSLRPWFMGNKMQFEAVACRLFLHYSYTLAQKASNYGIFCFYDRKNRVLGKSKDELYPYYGATGQIGFIDDFLFNGEYILLGEDAAPFLDKKAQKAYMIKGKSWVNNHAHILQSLVFPEYLTNCLNSIDYFDYVYGTTRLKLTQENMNRILVPVPSIEEQCKIAQAINNLFVLIESIKASLS